MTLTQIPEHEQGDVSRTIINDNSTAIDAAFALRVTSDETSVTSGDPVQFSGTGGKIIKKQVFTGSQTVETTAGGQLTTAAKGTAYNKNFGTGATDINAGNTTVLLAGDQTINGIKTFPSSPIVPSPVSGGEATNKTYVDAALGGASGALPFYIGAGSSTTGKTYWNYDIPFISGTAALWTGSNVASVVSYVNWIDIATLSATNADIAYTSVVYTAPNSQYAFSSTKKIVAEFFAQCNSIGTDAMTWGLSVSGGFLTPYNSAANDRAVFTVDPATSKLYAHTSGGGGTTDHTEVEITGITLTNENRYRVEFDPGSAARFYVNGVIKATIGTTLPNSGSVLFGVGTDYVAGSVTDRVRYFTAPCISVEK